MRAIASKVLLAALLFAGAAFGAGAAWSAIANECIARCERLCAVRPDKPVCFKACQSRCPVSETEATDGPPSRVTHHHAFHRATRPGIIDTRSAPLVQPGEEADGFGLYTYVLVRHSADRDSHFLQDLVTTAPSAAGVAPPLRAQIDLMLIPANPCPTGAAATAANCSAPEPETIAGDLKAQYNFEESNTILEQLCANPPQQIVKFCREPFGEGPFLFTYARPVSKMNSIPPPFLFFDFTDQDEAAFPDYIDAYEAVLKSDDFTDDSKLKTLRLRILDVYNRARTAAGPAAEGAVKLIHLFY
jgi:hypothetical protein